MYTEESNCAIFNTSLFNDLQYHEIILNAADDSLSIRYKGPTEGTTGRNNNTYPININVARLTSLISDNIPSSSIDGAWYPAYINTTDSDQYKKAVLERINYSEPLLGVANFIDFTGKFLHWRTDSLADAEVDRNMVCDWFITTRYNNFKPINGILFWFKKIVDARYSMWFYEMPVGTLFFDGGDLKQKLDYHRVKNLEIDRSPYSSTTESFSFSDESEIEIFDKTKTEIQYTIYQKGFSVGGDYYEIYIPDGEAFAFYDSETDRLRTQNLTNFSFSYVSPSLYSVYREIDNALYPYNRGYSMGRQKSRAYQMLCSFLSTMPQIDRVTTRRFSKPSVRSIVVNFLNNCSASSETEQSNKLRDCILSILNDSFIDQTSVSTGFDGVVSDKRQLFKKIVGKYNPELYITEDTRLRYINGDDTYRTTDSIIGHHLSISNISNTYYNENSAGDMLINNYTIFHGTSNDYMEYETNFTSTTSDVNLSANNNNERQYNKKLYLADVGISPYAENHFYLGPGFLWTGDIRQTQEMAYTLGAGIISYDSTNFKDPYANAFEATYSWRINAGPYGLRFHNLDSYSTSLNGTVRPIRVNSYNASTEADPEFLIFQSGTYELECTRQIGSFSQTDRVILTTDPNYTLEQDLSAQLTGGPVFKKINCGLSRNVAFDKTGIIWLVDTHHYINNGDVSFNDEGNYKCMRAKDVKLFLGDDNDKNFVFDNPCGVQNYLYLDLKPGNTSIGLYLLNISSLRDVDHPKCASTYKEKVFARRGTWPSFDGIQYNRSHNLTRGSVISYEVDTNGSTLLPVVPEDCEACRQQFIEDCLQYCEDFSTNVAQCQDECTNEFGQANATAACAPCRPQPRNTSEFDANIEVNSSIPLDKYGGYDPNKVLGDSRIFNHSDTISLNKKNDVFYPTGIFCYRENIAITGNEILLTKGLFHPNSGFLPSDSPNFIDDRSYVLEDRTEIFKTHVFDGRGFYDLRPAVTGINKHSSLISIPNFYRINDDVNDDPRRYCGLYGYKETSHESTKKTTAYLIGWDTPSGFDEDRITGELQESYTFYENTSINTNITNVEVNLNYLNYMNPRNLAFSLEVDGITSSSTASYDLYETGQVPSNNTNLVSYINALDSLHGGNRLYLLNQEHVFNYNFNHVFKFSDFYDKNIVAGNRGNYVSSISNGKNHAEHTNLKNQNSEEYLQPTLFAWDYGSDDNQFAYVNAIKNNNFIKTGYTLNKFASYNIGGLSAKLKVEVINQFDFRTDIKDNMLSNDVLSGLNNTNKRTTSNTINNSLCNWQLILHTGDMPSYHFKDTLGIISYDNSYYLTNQPTSKGPYNYIFGANFVVPDVNKNAPYNYISSRNDCSYYDVLNELLGDSLGGLVRFPSLLSYALFATSMFGLTTFIGASIGLTILSATMSAGGINDPIISYLIGLRIQRRADALNEQYYRPVYKNYTYGKPDRAVVCLSNNKSYWWTTEVPIFKYTNTKRGQQQKLFYIKLHKNSPYGAISRFKYNLFRNYREYDLINCNYIINTNVQGLTGTPVVKRKRINNHGVAPSTGDSKEQNIQLISGDIVRLDAQSNSEQNGYYLVQDTSWIKFPSTSATQFLQNNILYSDLSDDIDQNLVIAIDGFRAYYFFEVGQEVLLAKDTTRTILNKSLISTNKGQKTLLTLDDIINPDISIGDVGVSEAECNSILIFNPEYATSTDITITDKNRDSSLDWLKDIEHIYKWPFQEQKAGFRATDYAAGLSPVGEGNIGYGTPILDYGILHKEQLKNKTWNIFDNINNTENNQYKYFNFEVDNAGTKTYFQFFGSDALGDKLRVYKYSGKDLGFISPNEGYSKKMEFIPTSDFNIDLTSLDNHYNPLYSALSKISESNFIEIKTDKIKNANIQNTGTLIIDQNLNFNNSIIAMSTGDYAAITGQIDSILDNNHAGYDSFAVAKTGINLMSLRSFYKTLDPIEPSGCWDKDFFSFDDCPRSTIKQRISSVTNKLSEMARAIDICTTGYVIPHVTGQVSLQDGLYSITYLDNEYYWIHIDPENGCFASNEFSVKIPIKTEYSVTTNANNIAGQQLITDSQISPVQTVTDYALPTGENGIVKVQDNNGGLYTITYTEAKQQELKDEWLIIDPNLNFNNMVEYTIGSTSAEQVDIQKMMFNYGDNSNDILFAWRDFYERPAALGAGYANYRLKEVLDFDAPLYMKFRNMPSRKLKSHDQRFDKYYPTKEGTLAKSVYLPSTDYSLVTDFYCWKCVNQEGLYVDTPDFYKVMNEAIFRGFFSSTDGVENTNSLFLESLEPWEYIPYEFHSLCCDDLAELDGDVFVLSICNYNAITDDDFDIYWNGDLIASDINLIPATINDTPMYHIIFGSDIHRDKLLEAGDCRLASLRGSFLRSISEILPQNVFRMEKKQERGQSNSGSISLFKLYAIGCDFKWRRLWSSDYYGPGEWHIDMTKLNP